MRAVVLRAPGPAEILRVEEVADPEPAAGDVVVRLRAAALNHTTGPVKEFVLRSLFWRQVTVFGTTMGNPREFEAMLALYGRGGLRPVVDRVLPLEEAAAAHWRMEEAGQFGKIVLRI